MTTEVAGMLNMEEMLAAGLTPRQLHYWATKGWLRPTTASPGTGNRRHWPAPEKDIARLMVRLLGAGLTIDVAAAAARVVVEHGQDQVTIGDGVTISLREVA